jgi:signal transduction histidine kinase/CheY-like chemotaxis protein/ABC-type amino acid transport substrate-binding protein
MPIIVKRLAVVLIALTALASRHDHADTGPRHGAAVAADTLTVSTYREIPGVTEEDIAAIEALRLKYKDSVLVYGVTESMEAFNGGDGEVHGFASHVAAYMSKIFGLKIKAEFFDWGELISGLESGRVHFSSDLTPSDKRRETHHSMTSAIANRATVYFCLEEKSEPLAVIAARRALRYGFLEGANIYEHVSKLSQDKFEAVFVAGYDEARDMLKRGKIDAFFDESPAKAVFDSYGGIKSSVFLPMIYEPAALCTQTHELAPVISVMEKYLNNGGRSHFVKLYNLGLRDYNAHKLFKLLTNEERAYIWGRPTVLYAAEYDNYPFSFYNQNDKQWQGIAHDILREVEALTGLTFRIANKEKTEFSELLRMLEAGEVSFITDLVRTGDRVGRFLWPNIPMLLNRYALVSRLDYRDIGMSEVVDVRVGVQSGTVYEELFKRWFPEHSKVTMYGNTNDLFSALEHGEVDIVMSSQNQVLAVTNYMERPGYKINLLFDYASESAIGFNKEERVLCSIIDKAQGLMELTRITDLWLHKTYDYRLKIAESRQPLLISISVLLICIVGLMFVLLKRRFDTGRRLEALIEERTAKLHSQNNLLEAVTNNYKGIIWSIDTKGIVTLFNGCSLKKLGIDRSLFVGQNMAHARQIDYRVNKVLDAQKQMFLGDGPHEWINDVDGETYLSNTVPIRDAAGNVVGITGTTDNITETVRLNKELKTALEAAEAASRAKSAFLANMSHEIRTPMNAIIGFSELALDCEISEEAKGYIHKVMENSNGLLQIINDILDVSKIEAGKITLENVAFDIHEVFSLCRAATMPMAMEKGLKLHFYAEPFIGRMLVGDPTRLRQIFINLISNAVKFTNVGVVKVLSTVIATDVGAISLRFEVKDSGIGMTAQEIERVMEPFTQADHSTTRKYGGTGLGLSIVRNLVDLMGGKLLVESTPGIGSKFSFDLTFDTVDTTESAEDKPKSAADEIKRPNLDGEVLVCEDNHMNQEVIRKHLDRVGLRITIADNGQAGVDIVKGRAERGEKPFDLIFMDINMPVMDGLEASAQMTALNVKTPIVAMTANVLSSDKELYEQSNMHDCIGKPFTSQELWHCLLKYIKPHDERQNKNDEHAYGDDILLEMRSIFVNDNQNILAEFNEAICGCDIQKAHRIAHTLKSNAGIIGKTALQSAALDAEQRLAGGKNLLTPECLKTLETELNAVLTELEPLKTSGEG